MLFFYCHHFSCHTKCCKLWMFQRHSGKQMKSLFLSLPQLSQPTLSRNISLQSLPTISFTDPYYYYSNVQISAHCKGKKPSTCLVGSQKDLLLVISWSSWCKDFYSTLRRISSLNTLSAMIVCWYRYSCTMLILETDFKTVSSSLPLYV